MIMAFAQSIGIDTAKELITKKIKAAALEDKEEYCEEEIARICGELMREGGLVRIVAQTFLVYLERKLRKQIEEAYQLREEFLKETTHRIFTPVSIIGGYVDLLLEADNLDEWQREMLRTIRDKNREIQKLVNDVLGEVEIGVEVEVEVGGMARMKRIEGIEEAGSGLDGEE